MRNTHLLLMGVKTCTNMMEISVVVPQEAENTSGILGLPQGRPLPLLDMDTNDSELNYNETCSSMTIPVLFTISRNLKQPRCPSAY